MAENLGAKASTRRQLERIRVDGIGMRSSFLDLRMSLSENPFPLFRDMRWLTLSRHTAW
jgi:hypothetical protein